jgi:CotS family spore coat protein
MSDSLAKLRSWTGEGRLTELLEHHYAFRIQDAKPAGGVLKIKTDQGTFGLKRVREREELRWRLVEELARHISETGEHRLSVPVKTQKGRSYFSGVQHRYVVLPWIEAKVVKLNSQDDWNRTARGLAHLHMASRGFEPPKTLRSLVHAGKWTRIWEQLHRQWTMFKMASQWSEEVRPVDQLFLKYCSYGEGMLETASTYLEKLGGDRTVNSTRQGGEICHCNLHRRNVLQDDEGRLHFIDWNRAAVDVRSRDLARFALYAYGRTGSVDAAGRVLEAYQEVSPLDEKEYPLIYAQLLFPHRLMRIVDRIYREQRLGTEEAEQALNRAIRQEEEKTPLLREFPVLVKERFQTVIPRVDWLS